VDQVVLVTSGGCRCLLSLCILLNVIFHAHVALMTLLLYWRRSLTLPSNPDPGPGEGEVAAVAGLPAWRCSGPAQRPEGEEKLFRDLHGWWTTSSLEDPVSGRSLPRSRFCVFPRPCRRATCPRSRPCWAGSWPLTETLRPGRTARPTAWRPTAPTKTMRTMPPWTRRRRRR